MSRGSKYKRVTGRSGRPLCRTVYVAVVHGSPGFAMLALITRLPPGARSTEVIQMFWLSCQITFEMKPVKPGTAAIKLMSVQLAPRFVVTSMKPPAAPTATRLRSVGLTPRLYGVERKRRAVGRLPPARAEPNHFQPQPGWLTIAQVPVERPDDVVFQTRALE